jgi:hypothetical protein
MKGVDIPDWILKIIFAVAIAVFFILILVIFFKEDNLNMLISVVHNSIVNIVSNLLYK